MKYFTFCWEGRSPAQWLDRLCNTWWTSSSSLSRWTTRKGNDEQSENNTGYLNHRTGIVGRVAWVAKIFARVHIDVDQALKMKYKCWHQIQERNSLPCTPYLPEWTRICVFQASFIQYIVRSVSISLWMPHTVKMDKKMFTRVLPRDITLNKSKVLWYFRRLVFVCNLLYLSNCKVYLPRWRQLSP